MYFSNIGFWLFCGQYQRRLVSINYSDNETVLVDETAHGRAPASNRD